MSAPWSMIRRSRSTRSTRPRPAQHLPRHAPPRKRRPDHAFPASFVAHPFRRVSTARRARTGTRPTRPTSASTAPPTQQACKVRMVGFVCVCGFLHSYMPYYRGLTLEENSFNAFHAIIWACLCAFFWMVYMRMRQKYSGLTLIINLFYPNNANYTGATRCYTPCPQNFALNTTDLVRQPMVVMLKKKILSAFEILMYGVFHKHTITHPRRASPFRKAWTKSSPSRTLVST